MPRRLLITRPLPARVEARARGRFDTTLRADTTPLTPRELRSSLREFDLVLPTLGDCYDAGVFADVPSPRARLLANFGVGFNHIDIAAAQGKGVAVSNTPGAVTDATADLALTLILMTARRAGAGERMLRAGRWQGWHPTQMLGLHVTGKVLGVIGMGRIGQAIARRCHFGLNMPVVYFSRSSIKTPGLPATRLSHAHDVARRADVVVVAVPGGRATHHLIDQGFLAAMQGHAIFVNISRGDVVDETALISALEAGRIAGAGLDVYEHEPHVPDALTRMDNVTLLPHLGTAAHEVREAMGMMALDNLEAFCDGRVPANLIQPD